MSSVPNFNGHEQKNEKDCIQLSQATGLFVALTKILQSCVHLAEEVVVQGLFNGGYVRGSWVAELRVWHGWFQLPESSKVADCRRGFFSPPRRLVGTQL